MGAAIPRFEDFLRKRSFVPAGAAEMQEIEFDRCVPSGVAEMQEVEFHRRGFALDILGLKRSVRGGTYTK